MSQSALNEMTLKPLGPNGTVNIMISGTAGRETKKHTQNISCNFLTIWRNLLIWGPIGRPLDLEKVPPNRTFLKEIENK